MQHPPVQSMDVTHVAIEMHNAFPEIGQYSSRGRELEALLVDVLALASLVPFDTGDVATDILMEREQETSSRNFSLFLQSRLLLHKSNSLTKISNFSLTKTSLARWAKLQKLCNYIHC